MISRILCDYNRKISTLQISDVCILIFGLLPGANILVIEHFAICFPWMIEALPNSMFSRVLSWTEVYFFHCPLFHYSYFCYHFVWLYVNLNLDELSR